MFKGIIMRLTKPCELEIEEIKEIEIALLQNSNFCSDNLGHNHLTPYSASLCSLLIMVIGLNELDETKSCYQSIITIAISEKRYIYLNFRKYLQLIHFL